MCIDEVLRMGYKYETTISTKPGYELLSFVDPILKRRLILWYRSGKITKSAVNHLLSLLKVKVDILMICFEKDINIDQQAEELLNNMFKQVMLRKDSEQSRAKLDSSNMKSLYNDTIRVLSSGRIILPEGSTTSTTMRLLSREDVWLLTILVYDDGRVVVFDTTKELFNQLVEKAIKEGRKLLIFGIVQDKYCPPHLVLLYPT